MPGVQPFATIPAAHMRTTLPSRPFASGSGSTFGSFASGAGHGPFASHSSFSSGMGNTHGPLAAAHPPRHHVAGGKHVHYAPLQGGGNLSRVNITSQHMEASAQSTGRWKFYLCITASVLLTVSGLTLLLIELPGNSGSRSVRELVLAKVRTALRTAPAAVPSTTAQPVPQALATSTQPFDCVAGYSAWQRWQSAKQEWCCKHFTRACHTSTTELRDWFDCHAGFNHWQRGWSDIKKKWCCAHQHVACPAPLRTTSKQPATLASTADSAPSEFHCFLGPADRLRDWSTLKKEWCCRYKKIACTGSPATGVARTALRNPCDALCSFKGRSATCKARVAYAVRHQFLGQRFACSKAHGLLLEQCPSCGGCSLAALGCPAPAAGVSASHRAPHWAPAPPEPEAPPAPPAEPPPAPPPAASVVAGAGAGSGCQRLCTAKGRPATCAERVQTLSKQFTIRERDVCVVAYALTLQHCHDECSHCTLADTGCKGPEPEPAPASQEAGAADDDLAVR
mmetsp:Transcript_57562/g.184798  ORF Transcript_57562/g.184798 Transcript_57562/m.184798 type:complete len:509 (-) Transcript_57562:90-1616(-)